MTEPSNASTGSSSPAENVGDEGSQSGFANEANQPPPGLLREFIDFLYYDKKWWLAPLIVVLLLLAGFVFLSTTAVAPFIYPIW
jgi:hypothetical protein